MSEAGGNEQLVRERIEAFNRGDFETLVAAFDPQIESHVSPELLNAGTWRGLDGFGEMFAAWTEVWGEVQMRIVDLETPDDHHVIAHVHQRGIGAGSGVPVELDIYLLFEIAGDLATRVHVYPDRDSAIAAIE